MERLTPIGGGKRAWVLQLLLLAVLLIGPENLAKVISLVTSTITSPLTGEISSASNRYEIFNAELLLIYIIAAIGLNLLKQTGLLSAGHSAPFAIGAYVVGIATTSWGWSFYPALLLVIAATFVLGLGLGLPALRLGIFTFAMVSLGYAVVAQDLALQWRSVTGGGEGLHGIAMPAPFDELESFYWLVVIAAVLAYVIGRNYLRSPLGRASVAVEKSPIAAQAVGIDARLTKLRPFAVSFAFAGVAGALYAALLGFIAPDSFTLDLAILLVLMVLLGGSGTVAGPIIGAVILFRIPLAAEEVTAQPGDWSLLIYGAVLLLSVHLFPRGIMGGWWWLRARIGRSRGAPRTERSRPDVASVVTPVSVEVPEALTVSNVSKSLSGVRALRGVDLSVERGTIHALIGPNGSGKTTLLNVMSGYLTSDEGTVVLLGSDVTAHSVHHRARSGMGRTFQTPYVFDAVSCVENVMIALDMHRGANDLSYVARLPRARREERRSYGRAVELLEALGLGDAADASAGSLPPGERRLLELARVLALEPKVVLMDEPAAGLTSSEIDELEEAIGALRDAGVAVLLVEHHVEFVLRLADTVTVIDFGNVIAHGPPAQVRDDPAVLAAYLGEPDPHLVEEVDA